MLLRKNAWQRREAGNIRVRLALLRGVGRCLPGSGLAETWRAWAVSRADPGGKVLHGTPGPEGSQQAGQCGRRGGVLINQERPPSPEQGECRAVASQNWPDNLGFTWNGRARHREVSGRPRIAQAAARGTDTRGREGQAVAPPLGRVRLGDPMGWSPPAPLSTGFSGQEAWSGLPFPPPGKAE